MICPRCGYDVKDGFKFCTECGASMPDPSLYDGYQETSGPAQNAQYSQPAGGQAQAAPGQAQTARTAAQPVKKKPKVWLIVLIVVLAIIFILIISVVLFIRSAIKSYEIKESNEDLYEYEFDDSDMPKVPDASDIDLDDLNKAVEDMKNLDLNGEIEKAQEEAEDTSAAQSGEVTKYSYADVVTQGTDITITPNGGLNASTKLFEENDKDLDGFLDYVDSKVLEEGRTINRDLFYDVLATMLVDRDLSAGTENIESNMFMALAFANNFHALKVKINECELDANNASEYHYHVNAEGRDDIWIVDFGKKTVFFADGKTEYHSDMFKDDYLAVWYTAIADYYGL